MPDKTPSGLGAMRILLPCAGTAAVGLVLAWAAYQVRESALADGRGLFIYDALVAGLEPSGGLLYAGGAAAAWFATLIGRGQWARRLVTVLGRRVGVASCLLIPFLLMGTLVVYEDFPLSMDEHAMLWQAEVFARGELTGRYPPTVAAAMVPPYFVDYFFKIDDSGRVISTYLPGYALLMAPFVLLGASWLLNPLLAAGCLLLIHRISDELGGREAAGWAVLFTLVSPQFIVTSISYYSMTAHLFFNLLFIWGILRDTERSMLLAGIAGSVALVLHQPIAHTFVALPWFAYFMLSKRWRSLGILWLGYLPLALALGLGWQTVQWRFAADPLTVGPPVAVDATGMVIHGPMVRPTGGADSLLDAAGGAFTIPTGELLLSRLFDLGKLFTWSAVFLPILAFLGWMRARRDTVGAELLAASALTTLVGYFFVAFNQGHGWGYRYFHQVWGVVPILAGMALVPPAPARAGLRAWRVAAATAAIVGLVAMVPLRLHQTHRVVVGLSSQLPPYLQTSETSGRAAFIALDAGYYRQDLIRNDPFLDEGPLLFWSQDPRLDAALMKTYFPAARPLERYPNGDSVWQLPSPAHD